MVKLQLTDPANRDFVASIATSAAAVRYDGLSDFAHVSFTLPVLLGFGLDREGAQLVVGPRVIESVLFEGESPGRLVPYNVLSVGTSIGVVVPVGRFRLLPEAAIAVPVSGRAPLFGDIENPMAVHVGMGFLFGGCCAPRAHGAASELRQEAARGCEQGDGLSLSAAEGDRPR